MRNSRVTVPLNTASSGGHGALSPVMWWLLLRVDRPDAQPSWPRRRWSGYA